MLLGSRADIDDIARAFEKVYEHRAALQPAPVSGVKHPALQNGRVVRALTALGENTYLSAIRAGMVAVVPLTIIGGLFMIVSHLPVSGWDARVEPYRALAAAPRDRDVRPAGGRRLFLHRLRSRSTFQAGRAGQRDRWRRWHSC